MMQTGWEIIWLLTDPQWPLFWPLVGIILLGPLAILAWWWQRGGTP